MLCAAKLWILNTSAHCSQRSAIRVQVALLVGSRVNFAICWQSAAWRRNSSDGFMGGDLLAGGRRSRVHAEAATRRSQMIIGVHAGTLDRHPWCSRTNLMRTPPVHTWTP